MCVACPFNSTPESEIAYNYACLPTAEEAVSHFDAKQESISCHGRDTHCAGLLEHRPEAEDFPILPYPKWYRGESDAPQ